MKSNGGLFIPCIGEFLGRTCPVSRELISVLFRYIYPIILDLNHYRHFNMPPQGKRSFKLLAKRVTPTMKQKQGRTNKIIKADALKWKPVDVPDHMEDYGGLFGIEELEGVDVKMVNGKAEFVSRESDLEASDDEFLGFDEPKKKKQKKSKQDLKEELKDEPKDGDAEEKAAEVSPQDEKKAKQKEKNKAKLKEKKEKQKQKKLEAKEAREKALEDNDDDDGNLSANAFAGLDIPLPDDDIDLPNWNSVSLSPYLLNGLQLLGFKTPTAIQKTAIPLAIEGKDVIGKATTGSGKTLAYGLPILERHIQKLNEIKETRAREEIPPPSGIIFAPTRELAHQVVDHLNRISKYAPLSQHGIVSITGGLSIQKQERMLEYGPSIIVATPGRLLELIEKNTDLAARLGATDTVVLDEADRLLQDGHFEEFEKILELFIKSRDSKKYGYKWQTLVFSATFSKDLFGKLDKKGKQKEKKAYSGGLIGNTEILDLLSKKLRFKDPKPSLCDANPKEIVSGQVTEALVECGAAERDLFLYYFLLMYPGSTLVFANAVDSVKRLVPFLENLKIPAFSIHSSMVQKQRLRALERFKASTEKNKTSVLIASDVAARGLDIPHIDHVAHYHLPRSADVYIHRSGRTARAGEEGVSVMFCSPQEASGPFRKLRNLVAASAEKHSKVSGKGDLKMLDIDYDLVTQLRERVRIASKLADSSIASTATRKESSWVKQAAEDLGIEDLDGIEDFEDDVIKKQKKRNDGKKLTNEETKVEKAKLRELLSVPLRKNHRRSYLTSGLENLAHQIVSGKTSETVLGREAVKALDELKGQKKNKKNRK